MNKSENKLSVGSFVCFGLAGASTQILFQIVSTYQSVFYTDVLGISAGSIAIIMIIAKIWDAINDPIMGVIAERTRSKWGRFRPWLLWMTPFTLITFVMTFAVWPGSMISKALLAGVSYILFGMVYTATGIPLQSMPTVMTRVPEERVKLYAVFGAVSYAAGVLIGYIFTPAVMAIGDGNANSPKGYMVVCTIVGIVSAILLFISFKGTREVVVPEKNKESLPIKESFKIFLKDRNIIFLLIAMIVALIGVFGRVGVVVYYYMYVLERIDMANIFIALTTIGMLVPYAFLPLIFKKIDVKKAMVLSCIICAASCVLLYFANESILIVAIGTFLIGAGNWLTLGSQTLVAQIIDDNEVKHGVRMEGVLVSTISFTTKFASGVGPTLGVVIITAVGYIPNAIQTEAVKSSMNFVINIGPAIFYAVAAVLFMFIKMTNKKAEENANILVERNKEKVEL